MSLLLNTFKIQSSRVFGSGYTFKRIKHVIDKRTYTHQNDQKLDAYVAIPYSYAFGRSDRELQYMTIGDLLKQRAKSEEKKTAIVSHHENIVKNYSQFDIDVDKLAKGLYFKLGLRRGDVVGLWSCNTYSWIQIQYACAKLGIILCTINPVYRAPELNYALRKGQIKTLFLPGNNSKQQVVNKYQQILSETLQMDINKESDALILKQLIILDGELPTKINSEIEIHTLESLFLDSVQTQQSIMEMPTADDPAIIMFTSGTTGKPKGALLSQFTLVNNALLCASNFGTHEDGITMCVPLPLFHSFAAVLGGISMTAMPSTIVLTGLKYDVKAIVEAMRNNSCTHIIATPTMAIDILNYVENKDIKLSAMRGFLLGGAPVPLELALRISKVIPSVDDVRIGYGATELGPCTTAGHKSDSLVNRTQTVGRPLDLVEVKIVDPQTGNITKIGEQGELLSRGHNVMIGYWRDENKTKESINEAKWYKSGDLAVMDEFGFIKIIGRTKEMIIRGGENIYPREVEELLHTHPDVIDAYVIGVPDKRTGEEVCAWVKLKPNSKVSEEDIREFCKNNISYFKVPRYVMFVEEFPLTSTGKAKKFIMREKSCEILGLQEN